MTAQIELPELGRLIKHWRSHRSQSQLELGLRAGVSQRHISFIETGRSRPRQDMVERIADALDLPLRERNRMMQAAGLPPVYSDLPLQDPGSAPFRDAVERMLKAHEPYPAYVVDKWWNLVEANNMGRMLFPASLTGENVNVIEAMFAPGPGRDMIENFEEVARLFLRRFRREVMDEGFDEQLHALLGRVEGWVADLGGGPDTDPLADESELVICPRLVVGDRRIRTITMIARFGGARIVSMDELRVELVYPADDDADAFFREMSAAMMP